MDSYLRFRITRHVSNEAYATGQVVLNARHVVDLKSVRLRYRGGSVSGTMDVVKVKSGVPVNTSGKSLLTSLVPLNGQPDDRIIAALTTKASDSSTAVGYRVQQHSSVGLVFGGDLTGLEDLDITFTFQKVT